MNKIEYFEEYGKINTKRSIEIVLEYLKENKIEFVAVASTTGATGLEFARALEGKTKVLAITYREMKPELRKEITKHGAIAIEKAHVPFDYDGTQNLIRETYRTISQGFKVAVEVILIATDLGIILPGKEVIGVAGTEKGADTIIIGKSTKTKDIFSEDEEKKFEIHEILAFPKMKFWW